MANKRPIGFFWDLENCQVPSSRSVLAVVGLLRQKFSEYASEVEFVCVCDVSKERADVIEGLNHAQVSVVHVFSGSKNAADAKLRCCLRKFGTTFSSPGTVILISSDVNFLPELHELRFRCGFDVIIVHNWNASEALLQIATHKYDFGQLLEDIPPLTKNDTGVDKKRKETRKLTCCLEVDNLPTCVDVAAVRSRLRQLADNCGGRIVNISQRPTRVALLTFDDPIAASRAQKRMNGEDCFGAKIAVRQPMSSHQRSHSSQHLTTTITATSLAVSNTHISRRRNTLRYSDDLGGDRRPYTIYRRRRTSEHLQSYYDRDRVLKDSTKKATFVINRCVDRLISNKARVTDERAAMSGSSSKTTADEHDSRSWSPPTGDADETELRPFRTPNGSSDDEDDSTEQMHSNGKFVKEQLDVCKSEKDSAHWEFRWTPQSSDLENASDRLKTFLRMKPRPHMDSSSDSSGFVTQPEREVTVDKSVAMIGSFASSPELTSMQNMPNFRSTRDNYWLPGCSNVDAPDPAVQRPYSIIPSHPYLDRHKRRTLEIEQILYLFLRRPDTELTATQMQKQLQFEFGKHCSADALKNAYPEVLEYKQRPSGSMVFRLTNVQRFALRARNLLLNFGSVGLPIKVFEQAYENRHQEPLNEHSPLLNSLHPTVASLLHAAYRIIYISGRGTDLSICINRNFMVLLKCLKSDVIIPQPGEMWQHTGSFTRRNCVSMQNLQQAMMAPAAYAQHAIKQKVWRRKSRSDSPPPRMKAMMEQQQKAQSMYQAHDVDDSVEQDELCDTDEVVVDNNLFFDQSVITEQRSINDDDKKPVLLPPTFFLSTNANECNSTDKNPAKDSCVMGDFGAKRPVVIAEEDELLGELSFAFNDTSSKLTVSASVSTVLRKRRSRLAANLGTKV